ncbi:hypothetical protein LQ327_11975 [Actinomycetospora endophytica]|uniref:DoxX family membrane protein n=1 Tax=Actinomycetospora endophytica TaxID=2291215 RepID=A0ABS8P856_9PSEU|nr:hypothetical protein [Actinomycetospora endophytica]MCD2194092.1 hypothetical protein [Actinomycetospora endophytica]
MRLIKGRHIPGRIAAGAFILNSGIEKSRGDEQTAAAIHGMASGTYPFLGKLTAPQFLKALSTAEIALGAALLLPIVPTIAAGTALAAFSGGLLGLYLRTPGMRQEGSLKPTQQGTAIAKDVWMLGIAGGFIVDEIVSLREQPKTLTTIMLYDAPEDDEAPAPRDPSDLPDDHRFVIVSGPQA